MTIIGLTGPIAAGKDEVARLFRRRGAAVIDADKLAHQLYSPQTPAWHELVKAFGSKILLRGGKINRKKLAEIVFADPRQLRQLDRLVHPYLKAAIIKEVEQETKNGRKLIVISAAVLKEIGLLSVVDRVVVVIASKETRLKRLIEAGFERSEAIRRIKAQMGLSDYVKMADIIVKNDGSRQALARKFSALKLD
jgi:dephospho-CoA kinase